MAFLAQFAIIAGISCLGEGLKMLLPFPIPASVYGLVLMLGALMTGLVKLHQVKDCAAFLIQIMPVLYIPSIVQLPQAWHQLAPVWLPVLIITIATTLIVVGCAARTTQMVIRLGERRRRHG